MLASFCVHQEARDFVAITDEISVRPGHQNHIGNRKRVVHPEASKRIINHKRKHEKVEKRKHKQKCLIMECQCKTRTKQPFQNFLVLITGFSNGEIKDCNSLPTNAAKDVDQRSTAGMSNAFGSVFGTNMTSDTLPI